MTTRRTALARRRPLHVPRAVRVAVLSVLALWAVYLVAANVLLRTRLLRHLLDADEERFFVDYGAAWTLVPGRVHVDDLALRIQDDNIQLLLVLERATFQLDPFALASRTFHLTSVRADGVTFRFRHKLAQLRGQEARAKAYPEIPGFADPPIREPKPNLPIPESEYRLWTVQLDDVAASIRELWIMEYRYRGSGSVAGSFRLKPVRELWVDPSVLVTDGGVVSVGDDDVLLRSRGRLEMRVEPYDVRVPSGAEVLRHVTAHVKLEGDVPSIEPLVRLYARRAPVRIRRGAGHLAIDARASSGVLATGARATFTTDAIELDAEDASIAGDLRMAVAAGERLTADAHVGGASLLARGEKEPALHARDLHAEAGLGTTDLVSGPGLESLAASVGALSIPDLRGLAPFLPNGIVAEGGSATASARASWRSGTLEGRADVGLDRAHARLGDVDLSTSGRAWAALVSADPTGLVAIGPGGADLSGMSVQIDKARADGLSATIRAHEATIRPSGASAVFHVEAGPGDRTLRLLAALASLPDVAASAAGSSDLAADVRVARTRGTTTVALLAAKNGKLDARGRLATARSDTNGAFLVEVGPLRAGIEVKGGHASVKPLVGAGWLDEHLPP